MSPERPGRWVSLRRGPGKSWQAIQGTGALSPSLGARLGAVSPILRCFLTGSWGSLKWTEGDSGAPGDGTPEVEVWEPRGESGPSGWLSASLLSLRCPRHCGEREARTLTKVPESRCWPRGRGLDIGTGAEARRRGAGRAARVVVR